MKERTSKILSTAAGLGIILANLGYLGWSIKKDVDVKAKFSRTVASLGVPSEVIRDVAQYGSKDLVPTKRRIDTDDNIRIEFNYLAGKGTVLAKYSPLGTTLKLIYIDSSGKWNVFEKPSAGSVNLANRLEHKPDGIPSLD